MYKYMMCYLCPLFSSSSSIVSSFESRLSLTRRASVIIKPKNVSYVVVARSASRKNRELSNSSALSKVRRASLINASSVEPASRTVSDPL